VRFTDELMFSAYRSPEMENHMYLKYIVVGLGILATGAVANAQTTVSTGTGQGGSPHVKTTWVVDGATISVEYGRPYLKGRPQSEMMPVGKPWRVGADQATVLTTDKPLVFGTVKLAPGSYTINTEPGDKAWQLIFGKLGSAGQWGIPYLPNLEIARTPMTLTSSAKPVEQVTIAITGGSAPTLRIEWGTVVATSSFHVEK
jgi:hypothetical protein